MKTFFAAAGMLCIATSAMSASLTVTDIEASWSSSSPTVDGLGSTQIRWGTAAEVRRSGYNFSSSPVPFTVEDENNFVIGTFSHENFPITDTLLQSADLAVQFSVVGVDRPITSTFSFAHDETRNTPLPGNSCTYGGAFGAGVNTSGCADAVMATLNEDQTETFSIDGVSYVLDIFGFQDNGSRFTNFLTRENQSNDAELVAVFSVLGGEEFEEIDDVGNNDNFDDLTPVPLPASGLLILAGLAGLGMMRRRRS